MNCLDRANVRAGAAIGANIRINLVDITFRYCFYRTFINACSASCAIFVNFVSHFCYFWLIVYFIAAKVSLFF